MKNTWVKIKRGLIADPKHRNTLGIRIWLYMHMLDRVNWETGIILEWRDKEEAADMEMSWRTLQDQRQQLEKDGYITCLQMKDHQKITIHNYTNPREYDGKVYNKGTESSVRGGTTKGTTKGTRKFSTPTYSSHNTDHINDEKQEEEEEMILTKEQEIWNTILAIIKPDIALSTYQANLEPTQAIKSEDGVLYIKAENAYKCAWLNERLKTTIENQLRGFDNGIKEVLFVEAE